MTAGKRPCLRLLAMAALLLARAGARAADEPEKTEPPKERPEKALETLVIRGGDLYTITGGIIRNGSVLIEKGKIAALGARLVEPDGAQVIDAQGKVIMPGLVAASLGGLVRGSDKDKVADALDPYHVVVSFALASGITSAFVQIGGPDETGIGGTNAIIKMTEGDLEGMLVREPVAVNAAYTSASPRQRALFRASLRETREYLRKKEQYEKDKAAGKKVEEPKAPSDASTMQKLLSGELPAVIEAPDPNDILHILELVDEFGIRVILDAAHQAWTVAQEIAKRDVDAIITPRRKYGKDRYLDAPSGTSDAQPAILRQAGIRFAIVPQSASFGTWGGFGDDLFTLPLDAAYAVGGGLDEETALEAITIDPAEMFGVEDRIGSLQVGKDADIIILDGHPLHYSTLVDMTLANGKVLYDRSKVSYFSHIREMKGGLVPPEEPEEAAPEEPEQAEGEEPPAEGETETEAAERP